MDYLLLIYEDEKTTRAGPPDPQVLAEYQAFDEFVRASGKHKGGEALQSTPTAKTVRVRDNETLTTDGPFAETKEQLGGFYMIEADSVDEAAEIAARIPAAKTGCVEVRPVWKISMD